MEKVIEGEAVWGEALREGAPREMRGKADG